MKRIAVLGLILTLAGCDEPTVITHVDKLSHLRQSDMVAMQDGQGIPVEIHGAPFDGASRKQIAAALRPPAGAAQGIRFYALPPDGRGSERHGMRLVLRFNPNGAPNSVHDCRMAGVAQTAGPPVEGYSVNVSFCQGKQWQAQAYLRVLRAEPGDFEGFGDAMGQVWLAIFRENSDPDR